MKKNIFLGQIRAILITLGALCFAGFEGWGSVVGLLVAVAAIVWSFTHYESEEIIFTSIRKALTLAPGVFVYLGWLEGDQAGKIVAVIMPLAAMVWSWRSNGGTLPPPPVGLLLMAAVIALSLPSCEALKGANVRGGVYYQHESGSKAGLTVEPGKAPSWLIMLKGLSGKKDGLSWELEPAEVDPQK